ncbi:MAG: GspE/PulE family protein [Pirellulaceae bacterium]
MDSAIDNLPYVGKSGRAMHRNLASLPLGEQLVAAGMLTPSELDTALQEQTSRGKRLGEVLSELGFVEESTLLPLLAAQMDVPAVRLREGLVDPEVVKLIPREAAERLVVLALFRVGDELTVAMADPQALDKIDQITRLTGYCVRPVLALQGNIQRLLQRCYEEDFSVDDVTASVDVDAIELDDQTIDLDLHGVKELAEGSPVVNLVNYAVIQAVRQGASDIHIEPGQKNTSIRFRVDGQLREVLRPRKDLHPAIVSRIKVMAKLDIAEHRMPQDGRIHVRIERREIDLRVSTLPTVLGEKVVLRVLDRQSITFDLNRLGVPSTQLEGVRRMLNRPHGLVLVTGPTGSGKTTTLYSAIELIKGIHRNVVTVEDPVEYQLELINQVQVHADQGMTFAEALRSILRQDPDVILVGEIRDAETAEVAIQAALTGHLVLSTLHTNDSAGAITRLQDMGIENFKISAAVVGVIAQRLVRTICPHCRTSHYPPAQLLAELHYQGDVRRQFVRGAGCTKCFDSGYQGRRGIYEVLELNPALRSVIDSTADAQAIRRWREENGCSSLLDEGLRLAEAGETSLEEVGRVALFD